MRRHILRRALLVLAAVLTLASAMSAADTPVKVYDSAAALVPLFAVPAVCCAWGALALSERRGRDLLLASGLNLLVVWSLRRALRDVLACYAHYVPG